MAGARNKRRDPSAQRVAQPPDPERRSQVIATRVSPLEQQAILSAAIAAHMSLSDFVRHAALGRTAVPPPRAETPMFRPTYLPLVREINAIGVNLNQLTRIANASGLMPPGLDQVLDEINDALDRMMDLEGGA